MGDIISHKGVVSKAENGWITVKIEREIDCNSCEAKSVCLTSKGREKQLTVAGSTETFHPGDTVEVLAKKSLSLKATLYAFCIPLLLIILTIFILSTAGFSETVSGLSGLGIMLLYYLILYLFRNKLKRQFTFTLKKLNDITI